MDWWRWIIQEALEGAQDGQYDSDFQEEKISKNTKSILYDQKTKLLQDFKVIWSRTDGNWMFDSFDICISGRAIWFHEIRLLICEFLHNNPILVSSWEQGTVDDYIEIMRKTEMGVSYWAKCFFWDDPYERLCLLGYQWPYKCDHDWSSLK